MKRMPDKIEWWEQLLRWLASTLPLLGGSSFAIAIAYIRERKDGTSWKRSLAEAFMCGFLTIGTIRFIEWVLSYYSVSASVDLLAEFCGAVIGFLGTKKLYLIFEGIFLIIKRRFGVSE